MDIQGFERRVARIADRGLFTRQIASQIVCAYCDNDEKKKMIEGNLTIIENLNDEDPDCFMKLNMLVNEILY